MLRLFLFIFLIFAPLSAHAQEQVKLRAGRHENYVRLVFDGGKVLGYEAKQSSPGKIALRFKNAAAFDQAGFSEQDFPHIKNITVTSQSPLTIEIEVDAGVKSRDFLAGNRVIVDLYDPPGASSAAKGQAQKPKEKPVETAEKTPPKPESKSPAVKTEKAGPPVPAEITKSVEEIKKEEPSPEPEKQAVEPAAGKPEAEELKQEDAAPAPHQEALKNAAAAQPIQEVKPEEQVAEQTEAKPKQPAKAIENSLITFSSTQSSAMAVFLRGGKLWLVNSQEDMVLDPQVTGPLVAQILPFENIEVPQAKVFRTKMPVGADAKVQGGGLVWRVVLEDMKARARRKEKPVDPIREEVQDNAPRSGKIIWPLQEIKEIVDVEDPVSGKMMKVVLVGNAKQFSGPRQDFVDFEVMTSPLGLVILPRADDLSVTKTDKGVEISRPGGLALTSTKGIELARSYEDIRRAKDKGQAMRPIFDFGNWQMGGVQALEENKRIIIAEIPKVKHGEKVEKILTLAKMYLANGMWAEALGFLNYARADLPDMEKNTEFIALKGAAEALGWQSEKAFLTLSAKELEPFGEIGYWRAFSLADLGDWQQAQTILPDNLSALINYPPALTNRLGIVLTEVALRAGDLKKGSQLLKMIEPFERDLNEQQTAALAYLKGEKARQEKNPAETEKFWEPLTTGPDDMYRAKASMALTRLHVDEGKITLPQAIDNLERLRYAWRGDELEAQINYWLGKTYFEMGEYLKGLNIMREAAGFAAGTDLGGRITTEMSDVFTSLFVEGGIDKVSPLEAATLYEQFSELIPQGTVGDRVVERLAEYMVQADLMDRAAGLLQRQLDHHLTGEDAYRVGVRLAAIRLLDDKPAVAVETLNKAKAAFDELPEEKRTPERLLEITLLRARALSQEDRPSQALEMLRNLKPNSDVNRLKADIAWNAGYWDDAGEALGEVITDQNLSQTRPLKPEQAALLLQRAVALNLANDRVALANMRTKYSDLMGQTEKAKIFEVITRPRQSGALADRDTLMNAVSEVDLFKDFLDSYKAPSAPTN